MEVYIPNLEQARRRRENILLNLKVQAFPEASVHIHKARYWKDFQTIGEMIAVAEGWGKMLLEASIEMNPKKQANSDIACTWTFVEIFQRIYKSGEPGIFMVDDMQLNRTHDDFQALSEALGDYKMVQFWCWKRLTLDAEALSEPYSAFYRGIGGRGDNCLMLTPAGAEELFQMCLNLPIFVVERVIGENTGRYTKGYYFQDNQQRDTHWVSLSEHAAIEAFGPLENMTNHEKSD